MLKLVGSAIANILLVIDSPHAGQFSGGQGAFGRPFTSATVSRRTLTNAESGRTPDPHNADSS